MKNLKKILSIILVITLISCTTTNVSATKGYAYSMGGEFHSGSDVISAADYWALCGYNSYYNNSPTYSYVSSADRLNSDILYFSAHGNRHLIKLKNNIYVTDGVNNSSSKEVGIKSYSLSNTKLVVYDACSTAEGTSNLCTVTRDRGADTVIGWKVSIGVDDAYKWEKRFQEYCARGYKINLAVEYADSFTDYDDNSSIKSHTIYGNKTQVIKKKSASSVTALSKDTICKELETKNRIVDIPEIVSSYENVDFNAIEKTISDKFEGFIPSDYEKTITPTDLENNSFVVDYTLKYGEFSTQSGYTLIFRDNKATAIYDNTITLTKSKYMTANCVDNIDTYVPDALEYAGSIVEDMDDGSFVTEQSWKPYYDIETGLTYINVFTTYDYMSSGCYGAFSTLYQIS